MSGRARAGHRFITLLAASFACWLPGAQAGRAWQTDGARLASDPEARLHQRLIIKFRNAENGINPEQRVRSARLAIADLGNRVRPAFARADTMAMSLHRSIRPGLHVALTDQRLTRNEMQQWIDRLRQDGRVEYAEIDERIYPQSIPNDPGFASQWSLGQARPGSEGSASLAGAWDFGLGVTTAGQGVVVAVIDTGIRAHRDLAGNILPGYDFVSDALIANDGDGWDADPSDPGDWVEASDRTNHPETFDSDCPIWASSWHGTSMAGTIGAVSDNGLDIAGIAPHARLLPVRVFGKCGGYVSDVIAGLYWSVGIVPEAPAGSAPPAPNPNPARVVNLSMAAYGGCSSAFQEAIDQARARSAVVVAAAGNHDGNDPTPTLNQPANCRGVIAVTAHTRRGDLASYANRHPDVTLSAPGGGPGRRSLSGDGDLIVALSNSGSSVPQADELGRVAGTSIATAHVSGVVALLLGQQPGWGPEQVRLALTRSARAFPDDSDCLGSGLCGAGMLDATAALRWQQANPAADPAAEKSGGGGGAAGWPELLLLLSAALLARTRPERQPAGERNDGSGAQAARQSRRM